MLEGITKEALPKPEFGELAWENFTSEFRQGLRLYALEVMRGFAKRVSRRAESYKAGRMATLPSAHEDAMVSVLAECAVEAERMVSREDSDA